MSDHKSDESETEKKLRLRGRGIPKRLSKTHKEWMGNGERVVMIEEGETICVLCGTAFPFVRIIPSVGAGVSDHAVIVGSPSLIHSDAQKYQVLLKHRRHDNRTIIINIILMKASSEHHHKLIMSQ